MSLWSTYATDEVKEREGVWVDVPDDEGVPVRFKITHVGGLNAEFDKEFEKCIRPHRRRLRKGGELDSKIVRDATIKAFAKTVILDWENVVDREGNQLPCTYENALMLLQEIPHLYELLKEESTVISNFQTEALTEEAKNS